MRGSASAHEVPSGEIQSPASKKVKVQSKAPATKKQDFKAGQPAKPQRNAAAKAYGCDVSDEEAAAIYKALPFCFSTAPRMAEESPNDAFTTRAVSRIKVTNLYTIAPSTTQFLCPSPMTIQDQAGNHQAIGGWTSASWTGAQKACSGSTVGPPPVQYFWTNDCGMDAGVTQNPVNFSVPPDTSAGTNYGSMSVCGGLFCAKVMVPYNGSATVYNFGPSDVANLQGLGAGNSWRRHPTFGVAPSLLAQSQLPANPRRQYRDSVNFHATTDAETIQAAIEPAMLVGSSENAVTNFGFAIVPDSQFSPTSAYEGGVPGNFTSPDLYPYKNPFSGLFNGQGCMYITNTSATTSMTVIVELYLDYCVTVGYTAMKYLAEDTLAKGMDGYRAPDGFGVSFPGYSSRDCNQLMERIAVERIPRRLRNDRVLDCIKKLVEQQARIANHVQSRTAQIIPFAPTPKKAFETSLLGYIKSGVKWAAERFSDIKTVGSGIASITRAAAGFFA